MLVHVRGEVGVGLGDLAELYATVHRRAGLQRQAVGGEVVGSQLQGLLQRGLPLAEGLVREAVHEVDAEVGEAGAPGGNHRVPGLGGVVAAPQGRQVAVVERLDADAEPVEAAVQPGLEPCLVQVARVGLQGDLGVRVQREGVADSAHDGAYVVSGQVGRRAAAEEDRADRGAAGQVAPEVNLALQRLRIAGHQRLNAFVGVEVAVGALGLAEGDVDVERDGDVRIEGYS